MTPASPSPMAGRRACLVANPAAAHGRTGRATPRVLTALRDMGMEVDLVVPESLQACRDLWRRWEPTDLVVSLGGDGLHGAVAEAVSRAGALMAPLPGGRGNDFVAGLGAPLETMAAVAGLSRGVERRIDLAEADGRAFVGVLCAGLDARANIEANRDSRLLGRNSAYVLGGLRAVWGYRAPRFHVDVDGRRLDVWGTFLAVGQSTRYGGGLRICPRARDDDGLLDVVAVARMSLPRLATVVPSLLRGTHLARRGVMMMRGRQITVDCEGEPVQWCADGEAMGTLPVRVHVRPAALRVLVPAAP